MRIYTVVSEHLEIRIFILHAYQQISCWLAHAFNLYIENNAIEFSVNNFRQNDLIGKEWKTSQYKWRLCLF